MKHYNNNWEYDAEHGFTTEISMLEHAAKKNGDSHLKDPWNRWMTLETFNTATSEGDVLYWSKITHSYPDAIPVKLTVFND